GSHQSVAADPHGRLRRRLLAAPHPHVAGRRHQAALYLHLRDVLRSFLRPAQGRETGSILRAARIRSPRRRDGRTRGGRVINPVSAARRNLAHHFRSVHVGLGKSAASARLLPSAPVLARWLAEYQEAYVDALEKEAEASMHAMLGRSLTLEGESF